MVKFIGSNYKKVVLNYIDLVLVLKDVVIVRDLFGMVDIDLLLFLFCKEICKDFVVGFLGECVDEIFGGYLWFIRDEMFYLDIFFWLRFVNDRKVIVNENLKSMLIEELVRI